MVLPLPSYLNKTFVTGEMSLENSAMKLHSNKIQESLYHVSSQRKNSNNPLQIQTSQEPLASLRKHQATFSQDQRHKALKNPSNTFRIMPNDPSITQIIDNSNGILSHQKILEHQLMQMEMQERINKLEKYTKSSALRMNHTKNLFGEAEENFRKARKEKSLAGGSKRGSNGQENSLK